MSNPQVEANDDELNAEEERYPLCDLLYDNVARMATTWLGQIVYRRVDYFFSVAEKTARWSMPQSSNPGAADDSSSKQSFTAPPLVRPLPWILFLPALLAMRMLRTALSFAALLIGKQPVYPWTVVTFLQKTHRKLRAIKYRGQKLRRISTAEREAAEELRYSWLKRVFVTLRAVVLIRPTGVQAMVCQQNHHQCQQRSASKRTAKERDDGDSEISVEEGTVGDLLDKYANYEGDSAYSAEEGSEDMSGTSESETEESTLAEETPKKSSKTKQQNGKQEEKPSKEQKSTEASKQQKSDEPSKPPTDSNGESARDKPEKKRKSSLNVENTKSEEDKSTTSADASGGDADASEQEKKNVNSANRSKSATNLENEPDSNSSSGNTSKSTPNLAPAEDENAKQSPKTQDEPPKEGMKNGHQNGSKSQSAAGNDAKGNPAKEQRSKQQQQQHHQHSHQHQHQHQQSQHASTNGAGGGTKKQKRPSQTYY